MIVFERGVVYSKYRVVIPQRRCLCGRSYVYIVEILLCEGGGRRATDRTSKHILLFAFDPLSPPLSLLYLVLLYIAHIYMLDIVCVCPHLYWTKRASYNTSTLNLEESRGVVLEPFTGNSGSLLVTHSVLQLSFKFRIFCPRLASTPIHPPLGVFQIFESVLKRSLTVGRSTENKNHSPSPHD